MDDEQITPTGDDETSVLARMEALVGGDDEPEDQQQETPPETDADDADEPEQDDQSEQVGDEAESQTSETEADFEITYKGQAQKLSREEARNLAQLGKLYSDNQANAHTQWQSAAQTLEQIQKLAQATTPELEQARGMVALYQQALKQIDHDRMQALARDDPAAYLQERAKLDQLQAQASAAWERQRTLTEQMQQQITQAQQQILSAEMEMLPKLVPQWRDASKFDQAKRAINDYLTERKFRPQTVQAIANNAELVALVNDAMQYRALQKSRMEKVREAKPRQQPVLKPGAAQTKGAADADAAAKLRTQLRKTGDARYAAALIERML